MQQVKIYTAYPSDLSPPVQSESFCVDLVLASDYRELEAKCAALVVENVALKKSEVEFNDYCRRECEDVGDTWVDDFTETPATDAFLAEVRAQAHKEGAHFVANRMLAAWDAGFIDDTAKNAADIARMILTSTEFMADAPEGDFDRSFADGVLEGIAAQLRKGVAQ
ncbi:ead/Ea22-like family protein [Salmonella enterica]|nr:ead/Ea22-like family protein [Salmonella enterica]